MIHSPSYFRLLGLGFILSLMLTIPVAQAAPAPETVHLWPSKHALILTDSTKGYSSILATYPPFPRKKLHAVIIEWEMRDKTVNPKTPGMCSERLMSGTRVVTKRNSFSIRTNEAELSPLYVRGNQKYSFYVNCKFSNRAAKKIEGFVHIPFVVHAELQ